ncbi:MAG: DUF502 domain-containing protein [Cyanobacteria bacterium SZAS LIN-2]|nr:DUF502 domain-containing protein [Cyanobacteria bacterium SZAS LIN-3]MBS1995861.1 DUF502 domain-containing protein [Cyanobacteria bacterium SZAS LIN-2]MBS2008756.1 DUF502 domain-containing protein [Cyanobacteria bacterium SZAS TMP-1]
MKNFDNTGRVFGPVLKVIAGVANHIKSVIIRGALVFFPIAAIIYGLVLAMNIADGWLGTIVAAIWGHISPESAGISHSAVFSLFLLAFVFYAFGTIDSWRIGKSILKWLERQILKVQGIGKIYGALRNVIDMVSKSESSNKFKRVVFVPFLPEGGRTIGFVTNEVIDKTSGRRYILVFIPTPPNPISGLVTAFPEEVVSDSDMPVEVAIQLCVSLGMAAPAELALTPTAFCNKTITSTSREL